MRRAQTWQQHLQNPYNGLKWLHRNRKQHRTTTPRSHTRVYEIQPKLECSYFKATPHITL
jgi:hypothetical protein